MKLKDGFDYSKSDDSHKLVSKGDALNLLNFYGRKRNDN